MSEASDTLSGLNNESRRYMILASKRREYQYILNESREAMVLIFNSMVSREISGTNFTRVRMSGK